MYQSALSSQFSRRSRRFELQPSTFNLHWSLWIFTGHYMIVRRIRLILMARPPNLSDMTAREI